MDFVPTEDSDLGLCVRGNRKLRFYRNKNNPPKCRRQLFTETDNQKDPHTTAVEQDKPEENTSPSKDWVTCLKSSIDFGGDVTSVNQFQSYLQFINSYENQKEDTEDSLNSSAIVVDENTGKDFIVLNNVSDDFSSYSDEFQDQDVLIYYNNTNGNNCIISPDNGHFYTDVMLSTTEDEHNVITSCVTIDTPSTELWPEHVMGSTFEVDHEEVVQCLSGSFDTISCSSDDFSGSDEGFPDDFMDDE